MGPGPQAVRPPQDVLPGTQRPTPGVGVVTQTQSGFVLLQATKFEQVALAHSGWVTTGTHVPLWHSSPSAQHVLPHSVVFGGHSQAQVWVLSVFGAVQLRTHRPPHNSCPLGHTQLPLTQTWPGRQQAPLQMTLSPAGRCLGPHW